MQPKHPCHDRALELFRTNRYMDIQSCWIIAVSERRHRELEQRERLDSDERPSKPVGRLVGAERNG